MPLRAHLADGPARDGIPLQSRGEDSSVNRRAGAGARYRPPCRKHAQ